MHPTLLRSTLALLAGATLGGGALAAPSVIGLADFSGQQTVIDFNALAEEDPVGTRYAPAGVVFSDTLSALTNDSDTFHDGTTIASTWRYSVDALQGTSWSATFDALQARVGFNAIVNVGDHYTVALYRGAVSLGSASFDGATDFLAPGGPLAPFVGLGEAGGFDRIVVTTSTLVNGYFGMDDFRFEAAAPVPEPGTWALWCLGLGLVAARRTALSHGGGGAGARLQAKRPCRNQPPGATSRVR